MLFSNKKGTKLWTTQRHGGSPCPGNPVLGIGPAVRTLVVYMSEHNTGMFIPIYIITAKNWN